MEIFLFLIFHNIQLFFRCHVYITPHLHVVKDSKNVLIQFNRFFLNLNFTTFKL